MSTSDQLQQAYRLIRDGNKTQAAAMLVPIVRAEPNNADAWWLLANAVTNADQQRRALEQVLRLRPNDEKARRMLDRMGGSASVPPPTSYSQQPDPFAGASYTTPPQQQYDPFAGTSQRSDPFADSDPFGHVGQQSAWGSTPVQSAPPVIVRERRGTNPIVLFLAIIGIIVVVGCGACLIISGGTLAGITGVVNQFMGTLTADPELQNLFSTMTNFTPAPNSGSRLSTNFADRGAIEKGQTVTGNVSSSRDDGWTISGSDGARLVIDLRAQDDELDPQLYVYGPDDTLIDENDDVDFASGNRDSHLEITLPESGTYTIIVSAFTTGGAYELSVR